MRKHRIPTSWIQRDPRHYRFPIPNAVWEYQLNPIEFMLLSYLCCCRAHGHGSEAVSAETVASAVHLTAATAKKYLSNLTSRGLVTSGYVPTLQCVGGRKFFTLPNEIFLLNFPSSAFMVYAYLLLIEDRRTHTCHPSYNTIAAATGLAKNTVINSITALVIRGLITLEHSSYLDKRGMKWNGNNLYTILPIQAAVEQFHQQQLSHLTLDAERRRIQQRQERLSRNRPNATQNRDRPRSAL